ncbi:MAG TPA: DUF3307 domain-containing protein [Ohtaekwangia sp.]|nr:DUF3307 domain-containing protein [Ohtaekwangia sp.]
MILLFKLLLAHLIGDFILQPRSWVDKKETLKLKAWQFYAHVLIHGFLIMLLVSDWNFILPAFIITVLHGIIDGLKINFQRVRSGLIGWFLMDQFLHIIVIFTVWVWWTEIDMLTLFPYPSLHFFVLVTALVFLTTPTSVLIKILISHWTPGKTGPADSLPDAGKIIGILERMFILVFVLSNHWEVIGFLLAGKSIFRFGDLKEAHDRKLTEYVLIGTLLSFGMAILVGLALMQFFGTAPSVLNLKS